MRRDGTVKFDEDFDFETANAQFHKDEIDKELQNKLKLKGTTLTCTSHNGSSCTRRDANPIIYAFLPTDDKTEKALNGEDSEHPVSEGPAEEEEAAINPCYYDKSKSFFDNLSCDDARYFS